MSLDKVLLTELVNSLRSCVCVRISEEKRQFQLLLPLLTRDVFTSSLSLLSEDGYADDDVLASLVFLSQWLCVRQTFSTSADSPQPSPNPGELRLSLCQQFIAGDWLMLNWFCCLKDLSTSESQGRICPKWCPFLSIHVAPTWFTPVQKVQWNE